MTEQLRVEDRDGVRTITWSRPEALNAMSIEMWDGTRDALDSAESDGARSIVLTGTGRAFTVGQDLSEFADPRHGAEDSGFRGLMRALSQVRLPLVAAVNGLGVGFGLTVLPWCDIVLMAPTAKLKAPFVELGVVTEAAASVSLAEAMGAQVATWYLLTGEWITADAALEHGLALRIVDDDQLLAEATTIATRLAELPPQALRATVGLIRQRRGSSWDDAVQREYELMAELAGGDENIAAITKFFEKG